MRQTPLLSGLIYIALGALFTYFAIQNISDGGEWGLYTYLLIILATFDFGSGIRMIAYHFSRKKQISKK